MTPGQERIIATAFEEWGRANYTKMSLSPLADRLELTKPALYRHFRSKEALVTAMEDRFLRDYAAMHRDFQREAANAGAEEAVRLFIRLQFRFFLDHEYYYIFFLSQMLRPPMGGHLKIENLMSGQIALFRRLFAAEGRFVSEAELFTRLHFLYVSSIYTAVRVFIDCGTGYAVVPALTGDGVREEIGRACRFCLGGIMENRAPDLVDYAGLEAACTVPREDMPPPDRIFSAVESVVSEEGLRNASVDRIAARIGMSKSSLYFYFKNKDDIFRRMLDREKEYVARIFSSPAGRPEGFADQAYCCMVKTATYTLNNPALLTFFNWLRFHNIALAVPKPDPDLTREMFSFILKARDRGELAGGDDDLLHAAALLHVAAFRIVMDLHGTGRSRDTIMLHLRNFHKLYLGGIFAKDLFPRESV